MPATKEIIPIFLEKEPVIRILSSLLLSNSSYTGELQEFAEEVARQAEEVTSDE